MRTLTANIVSPFPAVDALSSENGDVQLGIGPEHLRPACDDEGGIPLKVEFTEFLVGATYFYGEIQPGLPLVVQGRRGVPPKVGQTSSLSCDAADTLLYDNAGQRIRIATTLMHD